MEPTLVAVETASAEETEAVAEAIGRQLQGGEVIELVSDLGGGKTTFVRGLARGTGSDDAVASPTFTISRQYDAASLRIYHFDMYRLHEPGLMRHELEDALDDPQGVVVVEWPEIIDNVLPDDRLRLELSASGLLERQLSFTVPQSRAYLMEGVQ
jgi:tRNA threonylcarbamoyladenosine biosynthesis protein TsaE